MVQGVKDVFHAGLYVDHGKTQVHLTWREIKYCILTCLPISNLIHSTSTCLEISSTQHPPVSNSHSLNIHLSPNLIHSTSTRLQLSSTQHPPVSKSHPLNIHPSPTLIHSTSTRLQISFTQHPPVSKSHPLNIHPSPTLIHSTSTRLQISFTQHPPVSTCPPLTFDGVSSSHVLRVPPEAVHEETVGQNPVFWCLHLMERAKSQTAI